MWINGAGEKTWWASWQDGEGIRDSPMGSQEQAIAAARAMPAAERVIFSRPDNDYIDLEEWLAARSG